MLVDTNNLITTEQFRQHLDQYIAAAQAGQGPIAVTRDAEVVGFFIGREEYEALHGAAIQDLLTARAEGPTVSHDEVRAQVARVVKRAGGKS